TGGGRQLRRGYGDRARDQRRVLGRRPGTGGGAAAMDIVELARLQFALTSIYHFLFVPVTIGLVFLVALLHTGWHRKGDEVLRRMARFFGVLLIVNVG